MNIMLIGSGGREAAIAKKVSESPLVDNLYVLPGNPGMQEFATCIAVDAMDFDSIVAFSKETLIDFAIVAPDDPLVGGLVDILEDNGVKCFGPNKRAAIIEGSKSFSKKLMKEYNIPTADYEEFIDSEGALKYAKTSKYPLVIKADGLALGKGVSIVKTYEEAKATIISFLDEHKFNHSSDKIIIEEFLEGPEISLLTFTDGKTLVPMISSMDHKRIGDGDVGPNTGGMGAIAPNPYYSPLVEIECIKTILYPTILAMKKENRVFKGCLYFGLILTKEGLKVIEYNCRFGDPETQVVIPLLKSDLLEIMIATRDEKLSDLEIKWSKDFAATVVLASKGYPLSSTKGIPILIKELDSSCTLYTAGVRMNNSGILETNGGRVLCVTSTADSLEKAIKLAYKNIEKSVDFSEKVYRSDIGKSALNCKIK